MNTRVESIEYISITSAMKEGKKSYRVLEYIKWKVWNLCRYQHWFELEIVKFCWSIASNMKPLFPNGSSRFWRRNMINRKFLPADQNKHRYSNLNKHHNASFCTCVSGKKGKDQVYSFRLNAHTIDLRKLSVNYVLRQSFSFFMGFSST